jgi:DNA-binding MarR family transcriptional regulator
MNDVERLEEALVGFFDAYRRSRARLQRDPGLKGLTWAQFAVLQAAARHGAEGTGRIAAAAGVAQPPATRALQRLEAQGLVRRTAAADRRRTTVELTAEGGRLLAHHRARLRRAAEAIAAQVDGDAEDAARVLALLGETLDRLP